MSRVPLITDREQLDPNDRPTFDAIVQSRGSMLRPFEALLHAPALATRVADLGHAIRFESHLSDVDRELVTLATGHSQGCAFIWESHLEAARSVGIGNDMLAALQAGGTGLDPRASALARLVQELCETGGVADETFRTARELVGTQGFIELVLTVGYYTMLAYAMSAVEAC
ncbi:MAG TPA: carboxymuconolactone decarboxylase family protein [Actinomycetota bacterium]|nr:carboxymuconolactone decarboxylase family protein [Actinomycetota bacterium]